MGKIWNDVNMLPIFKKNLKFESRGIWYLKKKTLLNKI
jgi:hypothetical protein